jgi:hypothetical protein
MEVCRIGSVPINGHAALDALQKRFLDAHPFFADE